MDIRTVNVSVEIPERLVPDLVVLAHRIGYQSDTESSALRFRRDNDQKAIEFLLEYICLTQIRKYDK